MIQRIPQFPFDEEKSVFMTYPKPENNEITEMTSSQMNKAIQRIWNLGPSKKTITATRIRKSTVTHVRKQHPESRESLAAHMSHRATTADKYYAMINRVENAVPMSKLISSVMERRSTRTQIARSIHWPKDDRQDETSSQVLEKDDQNTSNKTVEVSSERSSADRSISRDQTDDITDHSISEKEIVNTSDTGKKETDPTSDVDSNQTEEYDSKEDIQPPQSPLFSNDIVSYESEEDLTMTEHKRRSFTKKESETLIALCDSLLEEGNITKASITHVLKRCEEGRKLFSEVKNRFKGTDFVKKLVDRVHYERRRRCRKSE